MFAIRSTISPDLYVLPEHEWPGLTPVYTSNPRQAALYAHEDRAKIRAEWLKQLGAGAHEIEEIEP